MLTNMDWLQPGKPFPPASERERINRYKENIMLFEGKHGQVFAEQLKRIQRDDASKTSYEIILNWYKRYTKLFCDLLLSEPPKITTGKHGSPEQAKCDQIVHDNRLLVTLAEIVIDQIRLGVGLNKIRSDGKRAIIEGQSPTYWFPVVAPANVKDTTHHVLAWIWYVWVDDTTKKYYLSVEIHEKGLVTNKVYSFDGNESGGTIGVVLPIDEDGNISDGGEMEIVRETGVDEFLVIAANNLSTTDRATGLDDYSDMESIIIELEVRIAQISNILDKHASPNMYGGESNLEMDDSGNWVFKGGGKFFTVGEGEQPPGYITWDGALEAAYKQIEVLMEQLYILTETSPAAFGQLKSGLAESGSALKRLLIAPLLKTARLRVSLDYLLKETIKRASALEVAQGINNPVLIKDVHVEWQDGLPNDSQEAVQEEVQLTTAGLTSLESSLQRLFGLQGEALTQEVERIKTGQQSNSVIPPDNITLTDKGDD